MENYYCSKFLKATDNLFDSIRKEQLQFIHCIKSNDEIQPFSLNQAYVLKQIRYLNITNYVLNKKNKGMPGLEYKKYEYQKFFEEF